MHVSKEVYTVDKLRSWEALARELSPPPRFAVIGDAIADSPIPVMHNAALQSLGREEQSIRVKVLPQELSEAISLFAEKGFLGVNVTDSHQPEVCACLDEIGDSARQIGAVNTIFFEEGRKLGFNSEAPGFHHAIQDEFAVDLSDLRVLILGAGSRAGRAAAIQCADDRCERLVLVGRTEDTIADLARDLEEPMTRGRFLGPVSRFEVIPWEEAGLADALRNVDLIVNATKIGMRRSDSRLIPASLIQPHHLLYDTVYRPPRTRFLEDGLQGGARVANGLSLVLWQAVVSFEYWFNCDAPVEVMRTALREAVA